MVPESKATRLISSFPIASENYSKAVQWLKIRFGREDLLVEIFVRDLLSLMKNATALNFGLAAIHTKLGWTVIGKETGIDSSNDEIVVDSSVQTVLPLYVNDISLKELWEIDSLSIRDPTENVSKRKLFDEQLKEFHEELTVLPDGRYEVKLPWKLDSSNLPDHIELASKRHKKTITSAQNNVYLYEYQKIFNEWEKITREANLRRILWKFNPPTDSWWGGFWEWLVRVPQRTVNTLSQKIDLVF
ncbi:uncharacterized protein TNCV_2670131 [Trichonephila clavipes]|nr:uncharacterized protein TNCV_2670131 [Trichonephila clavipes]